MKIVINRCWGGFHIPQEFATAHGLDAYDDIERTDSELVQFVESHGGTYSEGCAKLVVVEIPETCTDWELTDYDGMESITAVVDGKLVHV
jgi:hypothetical protein